MGISRISRRDFIGGLAAAGAALTLPLSGRASGAETTGGTAGGPAARLRISAFTKQLQFITDYDELAATAARIGFDSLDLAVRKGGHVLPERVETDLPRAFEAARKAGLGVDMITTGIQDAADPLSEQVVRTAAALGIRVYRIGGWDYPRGTPIPARLAEVREKLAGIARMNERHGIRAVYQNHSGASVVGAPVWDLWTMMEGIDPRFMGINFDIGHATIEGGMAWRTHFALVAPKVGAVTVKDFIWSRGDKNAWKPEWHPLGDGMIRLGEFLPMVRQAGFSGPVSMHVEYKRKPAEGRTEGDAMIEALGRDLKTLRAALAEAGLG